MSDRGQHREDRWITLDPLTVPVDSEDLPTADHLQSSLADDLLGPRFRVDGRPSSGFGSAAVPAPTPLGEQTTTSLPTVGKHRTPDVAAKPKRRRSWRGIGTLAAALVVFAAALFQIGFAWVHRDELHSTGLVMFTTVAASGVSLAVGAVCVAAAARALDSQAGKGKS